MRKRSFFYDLHFIEFTKKRQIHSPLPMDATIELVLIVLEKMKTRIIQRAKDPYSFSAYKDWTFLSDGEVITITINNSESGQSCDIAIQSQSAFPKIWDFGVNNRNLNKFEKLFLVNFNNSEKI
jgi:hypothetical protein